MKPRIYEPNEKDFSHNGLGVLAECTRCEVEEKRNGIYELELEYPLGTRFDEYFENDYQIKAKPNEEEDFHIFFIDNKDVDTITNTVIVYAQTRTNKLGRRGITKLQIDSKTAGESMKLLQSNMDESSDIELYSDITTVSSTTFEARNVLNCIAGEQGSLLQYWGGEIKREPFKLSLLKRRGRDDVGVVRYGKDLTGLRLKLDWSGLKTRIIPYADIQSDTGISERIYGDRVDSPFIKNYPDIYTEYIQFSDDQGVSDLKSLNRVAKSYFVSINPGCDTPKISMEVEFEKLTDSQEAREFAKIRTYNLCDTFTVYHKKYKINLESKIVGIIYDSLNERTKKLTCGDTQMAFYQKQSNDVQQELKKYSSLNYMSKFNDYVSSMITGQGSAGGYVVLWPKDQPSNIFIMDDPDLNKAKEVLRMNKNGIAFSKNGWLGPFNSAWTLDSIFNANFIRTGVIQADVFENSFNNVGDILRIVNGLLQIWNNKQKIMELSKQGMEFWDKAGKHIGTLGPLGNPFPDLISGLNGEKDNPEGSMFMTVSQNGRYIGLSPYQNHGLLLFKGANGADNQLRGYMNRFRADREHTFQGNARFFNDVEINGKLTLNGQQVFPGQGGSGGGSGEWNGEYPPEVITQADKFAWELWVILLGKGYSKAAAAGILGNVQGEAGASMNPDISQIGGPAYGIVQWDGSAYPLVPPKTNIGRDYVQNLMRAAGITEDYRTMAAQGKLLDWCMYNGQWLGKVQPTSVAGFKSISDPKQAAYAFEENFERPLNSHPERQDWAQQWYDKFKDLNVTSSGDILTVAKGWLGWFYYIQLHPSPDLGDLNNPNKNGGTDCSGFVWLVLNKAGYKVPANMGWYTGSMTSDARGPKNWLTEIPQTSAKAGDVVIVNQGSGVGNDGHTAILIEDWRGYQTKIIEMGGMNSNGVGIGQIDLSFGYLLNGGDVCLARAIKR